MAVVPLTTPYSLKTASFTVVADDYTAAITQAQFDPTVATSTVAGIGGNRIKESGVPDWTLTVNALQDLATGSFIRYLLANVGLRKVVTLIPQAGGPAITATIIIVPPTLGGSADGNLAQASIAFPVDGQPVMAANPSVVPTLASALPSGAAAGAQVVIRGTGFTGTVPTTGVKFAAVNASAWQVVDDFTIVAVVPAGSAGSAPITVTNGVGVSAALPYTRA